MNNGITISQKELDRLETFTQIMERNPKSAVAEGWRRTANIFDDLEFVYSAVSSGKDSIFMTNICIMELQRRRWLTQMWENTDMQDEVIEILERYSKIREAGLASQRNERITCEEDQDRIFGSNGTHSKWANMRIGVMSMDYELTFNESRQVKLRFWKEYATDFNNILPKGMSYDEAMKSSKTIKELGFDTRWISENHKENPGERTREDFEEMTPKQLSDFYGKKLVFGYEMMFPIAWQNLGSASDSRYLSFDPEKKELWVTNPPIEQDPYHEWCMTYENMYDTFHGLPGMIQITPGLSDQKLRVEFSRYISEYVPTAIESGWPLKQYNEATGKYE